MKVSVKDKVEVNKSKKLVGKTNSFILQIVRFVS